MSPPETPGTPVTPTPAGEEQKVDIWRDSVLRYAGYANEQLHCVERGILPQRSNKGISMVSACISMGVTKRSGKGDKHNF